RAKFVLSWIAVAPEFLPVFRVVTNHRLVFLILHEQVYAVLDNRNAGVSLSGTLFPQHPQAVVGPGGKKVRFARDAVAIGATPLRPIRSLGGRGLAQIRAGEFGHPI